MMYEGYPNGKKGKKSSIKSQYVSNVWSPLFLVGRSNLDHIKSSLKSVYIPLAMEWQTWNGSKIVYVICAHF